jgi:hypothetical protein
MVWCAATAVAAEQTLRILVDSGDFARVDCPMTIALPEDVARLVQNWRLYEVRASERVPIPRQFLGEQQRVLAWRLGGKTPARTIRTFELAAEGPPGEDAGVVSVQQEGGAVAVRQGEQPVLRYRAARVAPPEGMDARYGRSGYIHPVWTPGGTIVSDEFPPDHPHQDGVFLAYVKTEFEGRQPDFWNLLGGSGFVRCAGVESTYEGAVCAGFRARHEHVDATVAGGKTALIETWDVCVWRTVEGEAGRRFDITSRIECAADSPLTLKQFHYGGMAFRGARSWTGENVWFTTPEGLSREEGNHRRVPWVDLSGRAGEAIAGVTVFSDPGNFRFPEPVRLHPTMPYFVFTPAVLGDWSIEPGRAHVSRYHYFVHDGAFAKETAERVWREIADPPRAALRVTAR